MMTDEEVLEAAREQGLDRLFAGPVARWIRGEEQLTEAKGSDFLHGTGSVDLRVGVLRELRAMVTVEGGVR